MSFVKTLLYRIAKGIRKHWVIYTYIKSQVFPGAIIIIHDGKPDRIRTVDVLARVLPELRASGYRVVTLSELVKLDQQPK